MSIDDGLPFDPKIKRENPWYMDIVRVMFNDNG